MQYLRGEVGDFKTDTYAWDKIAGYEDEIKAILAKRQLDASADWKAFAEGLSGETVEAFDLNKYQDEYLSAPKGEKSVTFLGKFIHAALAQKSMVTNKIYSSGNMLAGYSVDYSQKGFRGIRDFEELIVG